VRIPSAKTYAWVIAALRIYTGVFWISHAIPKFTSGSAFLPPNGSMSAAIAKAIALTNGPYHAFLIGTVQPHIELFAQLVRIGELAAGIVLLLGLFTRLGGLIGVALAAAFVLDQGHAGLGGWSSAGAVALALSAVSALLPAGRVLGVDAFLRRSSSSYEEVPEMPVPPSRPEPTPQPTANTAERAIGDVPSASASVVAPREPGPNGANGGPAFAAPASAGPVVDQSRQNV
jgi:uncharacterized membrane protein YphA (DoxX/SURF4 family)